MSLTAEDATDLMAKLVEASDELALPTLLRYAEGVGIAVDPIGEEIKLVVDGDACEVVRVGLEQAEGESSEVLRLICRLASLQDLSRLLYRPDWRQQCLTQIVRLGDALSDRGVEPTEVLELASAALAIGVSEGYFDEGDLLGIVHALVEYCPEDFPGRPRLLWLAEQRVPEPDDDTIQRLLDTPLFESQVPELPALLSGSRMGRPPSTVRSPADAVLCGVLLAEPFLKHTQIDLRWDAMQSVRNVAGELVVDVESSDSEALFARLYDDDDLIVGIVPLGAKSGEGQGQGKQFVGPAPMPYRRVEIVDDLATPRLTRQAHHREAARLRANTIKLMPRDEYDKKAPDAFKFVVLHLEAAGEARQAQNFLQYVTSPPAFDSISFALTD